MHLVSVECPSKYPYAINGGLTCCHYMTYKHTYEHYAYHDPKEKCGDWWIDCPDQSRKCKNNRKPHGKDEGGKLLAAGCLSQSRTPSIRIREGCVLAHKSYSPCMTKIANPAAHMSLDHSFFPAALAKCPEDYPYPFLDNGRLCCKWYKRLRAPDKNPRLLS